MTFELISALRPDFDIAAILAALPLAVESERVVGLAREAAAVCAAAGAAVMMPVEATDDNEIRVGDTIFESGLLREKIGARGRVFPYICTEGAALAAWGAKITDKSDRAVSHLLRQTAVKACERKLEQNLRDRYGIAVLSSMNPGSLAAWPLKEQEKLYALLEPHPQNLGISLLPSLLMAPDYSLSGIFFESGEKFYNCQLCPRGNCPNRKAPRK